MTRRWRSHDEALARGGAPPGRGRGPDGLWLRRARNPTYGPPGFFHGIWDGLIAPWGLALRLFVRVGMYAVPNTGWFYDAGFLLGVAGSIPIGWLAALIALGVYLAG